MINLKNEEMEVLSQRVDKHLKNVNNVLSNKDISSWAFAYWTNVKLQLMRNKKLDAKTLYN
jgi:hypothetical protein|tara:strand:+ start:317 stop:499 length:183 start_codon:yes stop_codon:yes gene_type:complete